MKAIRVIDPKTVKKNLFFSISIASLGLCRTTLRLPLVIEIFVEIQIPGPGASLNMKSQKWGPRVCIYCEAPQVTALQPDLQASSDCSLRMRLNLKLT